MFAAVETDIIEKEKFLKEQNDLIRKSIKGFKDIVARINVLKAVAKVLKVDPDDSLSGDMEKSG